MSENRARCCYCGSNSINESIDITERNVLECNICGCVWNKNLNKSELSSRFRNYQDLNVPADYWNREPPKLIQKRGESEKEDDEKITNKNKFLIKDFEKRSYRECLELMDESKYEIAVETLREYLEDNEDFANGWFDLAYALSELERHIEAIESWKKADEYNPEDVLTLYNWGLTLCDVGRFNEAIQKYEHAHEIQLNDAKILISRGAALSNSGRYDEAIEKYEHAHRIQPDDARTLIYWGITLNNLNRYVEAIKKFEKADKIQPEDSNTLGNWCKALAKLKRLEEAKLMCQRAAAARAIEDRFINKKIILKT